MFIERNTGELLNCYWLNNIYVDTEDNTKVIYEMVNGAKYIDVYDSESEAEKQVSNVKKQLLS